MVLQQIMKICVVELIFGSSSSYHNQCYFDHDQMDSL
jgi:hypothetical protein